MNEKISEEFKACELGDKRLNRRLSLMSEQLYQNIGESIPLACENWAGAKAAYRLLNNEKVSENQILRGHFVSTANRFNNHEDLMLIIHDTTEFSYHTKSLKGRIHKLYIKRMPFYKKPLVLRGILMHSSLIFTSKGLPLGISAVKFWTRKKFKGTNELKRHINPTNVPIEKKESIKWLENIRQTNKLLSYPDRCLHIGDREADIFELYCECEKLHTHFLVRLAVNRRVKDAQSKLLFESINNKPVEGEYCIEIRNPDDTFEKIKMNVRFTKVEVSPPIGKEKKYPSITVYYIEAKEKIKKGSNQKPRVDWKLLTNMEVSNFSDAYKMIKWYGMRWNIETYFKILKSGCGAERSKLRSAESLAKFISICAVIAWKVFWLNMINRTNPGDNAKQVLDKAEYKTLKAYKKRKNPDWKGKTISDFILVIAELGGYMGRVKDLPPGNIILWRGLSRLYDIMIGYNLGGSKDVGN